MSHSDTIEIRRLAVTVHIGVPDEERSLEQTIFITLRIEPSQDFDGLGDDIRRTVDYHAVAMEIRELAGSRPRHLIETLARDCANHILSRHPARSVTVTVEKHILPDTDCVSVSLTRSR